MEPPASTSTPLLQDTRGVVAPPPTAQLTTVAPECKKEEEQTHITLQAVSQNGDSLQFKVRMNTPLQKVINAYCGRMNVEADSVRFLYDGDRIEGEKTPEMMHMEDGDILDVVLQQTGGGGFSPPVY